MSNWYRRNRYEIYDFYDVEKALNQLDREIPRDSVDYETFDIELSELETRINRRINEKMRLIFRELRTLRNKFEGGEK